MQNEESAVAYSGTVGKNRLTSRPQAATNIETVTGPKHDKPYSAY
jgi:hypothetical protein